MRRAKRLRTSSQALVRTYTSGPMTANRNTKSRFHQGCYGPNSTNKVSSKAENKLYRVIGENFWIDDVINQNITVI